MVPHPRSVGRKPRRAEDVVLSIEPSAPGLSRDPAYDTLK
jgi:hypothetical protein